MAESELFRMPSLGADMTEGTVLEWLVQPGDAVHRGDLVAVVKTDKADVEIEVFRDGTIGELLVPVGVTAEVGAPLATIIPLAGATPTAEAQSPRAPSPAPLPPAPAPSPPAPAPPPAPADAGRRVSPYARRRAAELDVDLDQLPAQAGRPVTAAAVERAAPAPKQGPAPDQAAAMRAAIGRLMARSKREIPHYYLDEEVDVTDVLERLHVANESRSVADRVLPAALFGMAVARAARALPEFNGFWRNDRFEPSDRVHLGIAVALRGGGVVAPALHDADQRSLAEFMEGLRDLTMRARGGRLRGSEMTDATITVTILGDHGVRSVFGVIFPPQVALVGFGQVQQRVRPVHDGIGVRSTVSATLSADHRATDGHLGSRFLTAIADALGEVEVL